MKTLFNQEVKIVKALISIGVLALSFYIFTHINTPVTFLSICLAGLIAIWVTFGRDGLKKFFALPIKGTYRYIPLAVVVSYIFAISAALIAKFLLKVPTASNPVNDELVGKLSDSMKILFQTIFMLAGEELIVTVPLVILVSLLVHKAKMTQTKAIIISTVVTAIMFGALHLPTYNWNLFQCFVIIAITRIPFTLVTLKTNTMLSGLLAHITYDWIIFIFVVVRG